MAREHQIVFCTGLLIAVHSVGCSSTKDPGSSPSAGTPQAASTPPPATDHPLCVISADCPAGEHCDLGECVQDCSTVDPCTGGLVCTARARCAKPDEPDQDPAPSTKTLGTISVAQDTFSLTEHDTTVSIKLNAPGATSPVRYRVEVDAPHLVVDSPRGQFTGTDGTITLQVNTKSLQGRDLAGSVKVFTTLGEVTVNAPIHVGLTGSYQGALRYDGNVIPLGNARIALDMLEKNGDLTARVDSGKSLLFPPSDQGDTTGHGSYSASGLDLTLNQALPADFAHDRNHLQRPIGRRLHILAKPASTGNLEGTFDEQIYGLFTQPVTLSGHISLEYLAQSPEPVFVAGQDPAMPSRGSEEWNSPSGPFGWTAPCSITGAGNDAEANKIDAVTKLESDYYAPLTGSFAQHSQPIATLAASCKAALGVKNPDDYVGDATACALPPALACAMMLSANPPDSVRSGRAFGRTLSEMLAAPLLVAKNEVVDALSDSFTSGFDAENAHYDQAMKYLGPAATFVMQPAALDYLINLPPSAARGDDPQDKQTQNQLYPAARALADLFHTMSVIDGEQSRASAAVPGANPASALTQAQSRAVVTYLESAILVKVLESWSASPAQPAAMLTGVLSPLDVGFGALVEGANAFGIPSGFVPFVYRPEDVSKGASNFEQMAAVSVDLLSHEDALEQAFKNNKRQYELNQQQLQQELAQIRSQFDLRLKDICGASFDANGIKAPEDWNRCGANGEGQIADLMNQTDQATAKLRSEQSRIHGMQDKIGIDKRTLADTQKVHQDTLHFIDQNGQQLESLTIAEGIISAEEKFAETASQASITNFGAPIGFAAVISILELEKTGLEVQKQQLQTAQQMRFEQAGAQIELINGMGNIQKETIDLAQLGVDMQNDILALTGAQMRVRNLILEAKSVFEERGRALAIVGQDPANDPSFRILRDKQALTLLGARADSQRALYLAGRALEYEINTPIASLGGAVLRTSNSLALVGVRTCLQAIYTQWRTAYGNPQDYVTTVSVRKMLGISAPRQDDVTGEVLTEGDQFRRELLKNQNLDGKGGVGITFGTDLQPGNGLWSTDVCADRVASVQAQLVGDFLGDNQATVEIALSGGGHMRSCGEDTLTSWTFGAPGSLSATGIAVVQAGVNTFGEAPANTSLFGQPVARASWRLILPGASDAPANGDLDLTKVDDVVLKIQHKALPQRSGSVGLNLSCLGG